MNKKVICLSLSVYLASAACVFPAFAAPVPDGTNSSGETYTASQTDESFPGTIYFVHMFFESPVCSVRLG